MFQEEAENSGKVVGYKAAGAITEADCEKLVPEIRSLIEKEGAIHILFDTSALESLEVKAALMDLKFGHEVHHEIEKMAIVGDKNWAKLIAHLAKPIHASDARFFHTVEVVKARSWLQEESL